MNASTYLKYTLYLLLASLASCANTTVHQGMICVPVADLFGQPMHEFYGRGNIKKMYTTVAVCGTGAQSWQACPRLHQALLHDLVDIIEERNEEICIKVHNIFYLSNDTHKHTQQFWTLKSNVARYDSIKNKPVQNTDSTVIKKPIYIPQLKISLSAGTRCAIGSTIEQEDALCVHLFNAKKHRFDMVTLPKNACMSTIPSDPQARIRLFVDTVRAWANQKIGIIPYIWGGCSFVSLYPDGDYVMDRIQIRNKDTDTIYTYPSVEETIKTGLDCSGLISRAAQLCNIPYYCKNSITASKILTRLKPGEIPNPGDLIWFPGHLIIIADLQQHTIVEARGYEHGYGKVHEIKIAQQFEGINTYADLLHAYHNLIPLKRLDKSGKIVQTIPQYAIYKLASVFNIPYKHATQSTGLS